MHSEIQTGIVNGIAKQGYKLVEAGHDWLLFAREGGESSRARTALESIDTKTASPDFVVLSNDYRYPGVLANGWKRGRMMLLRLTTNGLNYKPATEEERKALLDEISKSPTPEEAAELDAFVTRMFNEAQGLPTSLKENRLAEKYLDRYVTDLNEERRQREARSKLQ
jgi:hypothetical protein